ncbi:peptide chain release factor N(5)-glutamine methyltransferase [Luteibacter sp. 22Crub2.1]|uniref:peptide chain release factor N(5)-glutamine methyltransferase n=1 Tax=Luteibacter sp. 22Crub2.1 TaxID=1283288 RepID=UPI0009A55E34|nr:peptide chain release factor N(5)-glutamine methyltransferase [Luteibacter sp. 22Crub2.1]SKB94570.1 [protein release factor]-glutamine N5-methyltransferase [Luteibacter sp. 22Crub2.1]
MTDVRTILRQAAEALGDRLEAELLLAHVLGVNRAWFFAHADDELGTDATAAFGGLVRRRAEGEPVAYITGTRDFWSMTLEVGPATLIPRPETELLVELVLERLPAGGRVLDLGTGSGAIALAVAKERPDASVTAVDFSEPALVVARRNAERHGLQRVRFAASNWYSAVVDERFDVIVSNPPYIESSDAHLGQGDLRFEPSSALASGEDGLDDIRRIASGASAHLVDGGWLLMEHGWNQGDAARAVLEREGLADVFTAQDLEARDRVSGAKSVAR